MLPRIVGAVLRPRFSTFLAVLSALTPDATEEGGLWFHDCSKMVESTRLNGSGHVERANRSGYVLGCNLVNDDGCSASVASCLKSKDGCPLLGQIFFNPFSFYLNKLGWFLNKLTYRRIVAWLQADAATWSGVESWRLFWCWVCWWRAICIVQLEDSLSVIIGVYIRVLWR